MTNLPPDLPEGEGKDSTASPAPRPLLFAQASRAGHMARLVYGTRRVLRQFGARSSRGGRRWACPRDRVSLRPRERAEGETAYRCDNVSRRLRRC